MRESTRDRAQGASLAPTPTAYIVRIGNAAFERASVGVDVLTRDRQAQGIEIAKCCQIWRGKGSVEQVEVFLMVSVRTSILGDLDPHPRAHTAHTLNCEEPVFCTEVPSTKSAIERRQFRLRLGVVPKARTSPLAKCHDRHARGALVLVASAVETCGAAW